MLCVVNNECEYSFLPRFISWYDAQFSIENDLITIQSCPGSTLDATRVEYIIQAIQSAHEAHPNKTKKKDKKTKQSIEEVTSGEREVNGFVEGQETGRQSSYNTVRSSPQIMIVLSLLLTTILRQYLWLIWFSWMLTFRTPPPHHTPVCGSDSTPFKNAIKIIFYESKV